jgi:hypothetical protein
VRGDPLQLAHKLRAVSGEVQGTYYDAHDTYATHDSHDVNFAIRVDPCQQDVLSEENEPDGNPQWIGVEWESGLDPEDDKTGDGTHPTFPSWVWPSKGDRAWVEGHWVFDCGHEDDELYHTEIHPPRAVAVMRDQAATLPGTGDTPVPVTLTDLYIHGRGGYMVQQLNCGMNIILTPFGDTCGQSSPPADQSFKTTPIDSDFSFDACLPPRPPTGEFSSRIEVGPGNTVAIDPDTQLVAAGGACLGDPRFDQTSMLHVTVPLGGSGTPPEAVYARRIYAGWISAPDPALVHRRVMLGRWTFTTRTMTSGPASLRSG